MTEFNPDRWEHVRGIGSRKYYVCGNWRPSAFIKGPSMIIFQMGLAWRCYATIDGGLNGTWVSGVCDGNEEDAKAFAKLLYLRLSLGVEVG